MKKAILLTLTVVGGMYVRTLSPDRQERESKQASRSSSKYSCTKSSGPNTVSETKLSGLA